MTTSTKESAVGRDRLDHARREVIKLAGWDDDRACLETLGSNESATWWVGRCACDVTATHPCGRRIEGKINDGSWRTEIEAFRHTMVHAQPATPAASAVTDDNPDCDATDAAHPAWWRGNDAGVEAVVRIANKALDGLDDLKGVSGSAPLNALRHRLAAFASTRGGQGTLLDRLTEEQRQRTLAQPLVPVEATPPSDPSAREALAARVSRKVESEIEFIQGAVRNAFGDLEELERWWSKSKRGSNAQRVVDNLRARLSIAGQCADDARAALSPALVPAASAQPDGACFIRGDRVRKLKGSSWQGRVVGFYNTDLTPIGYAVESEREPGSVQIYPQSALALVQPEGA